MGNVVFLNELKMSSISKNFTYGLSQLKKNDQYYDYQDY
jgi:hypothetical protein